MGHVLETNRGKVRKIREGADAGELGNLELDLDFLSRKFVRKSVERIQTHLFARSRANIQALLIWFGQMRFRRRHAPILAAVPETARTESKSCRACTKS